MADAIVVTCEHAGCRVPRAASRWFDSLGARQALASHRGWDRGASGAARRLARAWAAPLIQSRVSRLVVDLNRSPHHPRLFSAFLADAPAELRRRLFEAHWRPYRERVETAIAERVAGGDRVVHLSVHSFTPVLRGVRRTADFAFLYDPGRPGELRLCREWAAELRHADRALRVRRNYPYRGVDDGLTTHLRRRFPPEAYLGIELEFNQALFRGRGTAAARVARRVASTAPLQQLANRRGSAVNGS